MATVVASAPTDSTPPAPGSSAKTKQTWSISISSQGYGQTDADQNGRLLQLTLFDDAGTKLFSGSTDAAPEPDDWDDTKIRNDAWSRSGKVTVDVPAGTQPAVLFLEKADDASKAAQQGPKYKGQVDFIATVTVKGQGFETVFVAQRWIATPKASLSPAHAVMVLFAATRLPQDETPFVQKLRQQELAKLRGAGLEAAVLSGQRKGADSVYDYQTYNDLGKEDMPRPTLGGPEWPYPRRLATHLGSQGPDGSGVEPNVKQPWLPYDEAFSFTKATEFNTGRVSGPRSLIFTGLGVLAEALLYDPDKLLQAVQKEKGAREVLSRFLRQAEYTSFEDVADHFDADRVSVLFGSPPSPLDKPKDRGTLKDGLLGKVAASIASILPGRRSSSQPDYEDSAPPAPGEGLGSDHVRDEALSQLLADLVKGDVWDMKRPRVLVDRDPSIVLEDAEFGRQMLGGFNPSTITALREMPEELGSAIREQHVAGDLGSDTLQSLVDAAKAGQKPHLYWVDYFEPYAHFFAEPWTETGKVLHAGRALFLLKQNAAGEDVSLEPIAIELAAHPSCYDPRAPTLDKSAPTPTQGTVYSRSQLYSSGQHNVWAVAKLVFRALDVGVHQLISHWLRCHAVIEPFLIALRRSISTAHPVYKLMLPHFRYTLSINAAARGNLINAGGIIEQTFAPGPYAMRLSSLVYGKAWKFEQQALPADLRARGMVDAEGNPFITYPYAEDGLRIWDSMATYFGAYLAAYYGAEGPEGDSRVAADSELQAWWTEATTKAHPDLPDTHWGVSDPSRLSTLAELTRVLVTIAWTASAHHAAVNFGQYDFTSFVLNAPSLIRRPAPRDAQDAGWQELLSVEAGSPEYERVVLSYINSPLTNLLVAVTVGQLSTHAEDEQFLDEPNDLLTDPEARKLNTIFINDMKALEQDIVAQHKTGGNWTRCKPNRKGQPHAGTYSTCLIPGSGPGVTLRGVPYSVSI